MDVSYVLLTPSVARLLEPKTVPSLKTLVLIGESSTVQDAKRWWNHVNLVNGYGPSECTPLNVTNCNAEDPSAIIRIGRGTGVNTWIVDPNNHDRLTPIGAVGELLLEGPLLLGNEYLNDPEKTATSFINDPTWLLKGFTHSTSDVSYPGRHSRLYKTGDLVRYHGDGTVTYIGRKDTQVKMRGQRVELSEVEHYVSQSMPEAAQIAVEAIMPADGANNMLA